MMGCVPLHYTTDYEINKLTLHDRAGMWMKILLNPACTQGMK